MSDITPQKIKFIYLTQGKRTLIDKEDFELVNKYKWFYRKSGRTKGKNGYAQHSQYIKGSFKKGLSWGKYTSIFMHNLILPPKNGLVIDHINNNGLDNRRLNLRLVTVSQNMANFPKKQKTKSKYRGVSFLKRRIGFTGKQWEAGTTLNGKGAYIGVYVTEKEAAAAYNNFAKEHFGKCAQLNKI